VTTVVGIAVSVATAYVAMRFNNIMDMLQLVFSFVNAPLFATFLLGMFWRRTTGHGAFWGLLAGTLAAALHYELTAVSGASSLVAKIAVLHTYPSDMAQNFWGAIWAWTSCFTVTVVVSVCTRPQPASELNGLVYSLTPRTTDDGLQWYKRPAALGMVVFALAVALNILFR
jgi:solute:Na+ symporter, SSS family